MTALLECCACHPLNKKSDLKGKKDLLESAPLYLSGEDRRRFKQSLDMGSPRGVYSVQNFRNRFCRICISVHVAFGILSVQPSGAAIES